MFSQSTLYGIKKLIEKQDVGFNNKVENYTITGNKTQDADWG